MDLDNLIGGREIRVRAGEPLKIDIPIVGSPIPLASWDKDGKDVPVSSRVCNNQFWKMDSYWRIYDELDQYVYVTLENAEYIVSRGQWNNL